jgi:hypothetical protein
MAAPDFLCIGAQKAGTTWLDKMLKGHPQIWTPPVKELQFFSELFMGNTFPWTYTHRKTHALTFQNYIKLKSKNWKQVELARHIAKKNISVDWYEHIFDFAPLDAVKGETTPEYSLLDESSVKKIASMYPSLKIIFIMREPLSRALSGIRMRLHQKGFTENSDQGEIDKFIISAAKNWDVIQRGNYNRIISLWKENFEEKNCLWLLSDDLKNGPHLVIQKIAEFLCVQFEEFWHSPDERVHVGKNFIISEKALQAVKEAQAENIKWYESHKNQFLLEQLKGA